MRHARAFAFCSMLLMSAGYARAERKFIIGDQYDFSLGATNQVGATSTAFQRGLAPFYGFAPSVDVKSVGHKSVLDMSYTALAERYEGDQKLNLFSQAAAGDFTVNPSHSLKLDFRGLFSSVPDYTSVDVLKGAVPAPDTFRFVFQPATGKSTRQTFGGGASAEFDLSYRSYFIAEYSASWLNYQLSSPVPGSLVDQRRDEGRFGYWYRLDPHRSIDIQYVVTTNNYSGLGTGRTHAALIGYTRQFSPALQMHFDAGPAYVTFSGIPSYYGYVLSASLVRTIRSSRLSAFYSHTPGDSTGFGTLSDVHSGGLALFSPIWKRIAVNSSISGFWARGAANSLNSYEGGYGTLEFAYPLNNRWFLTWGGSYALNVYNAPGNQEFKRLYMSIRFRAPEFWRGLL